LESGFESLMDISEFVPSFRDEFPPHHDRRDVDVVARHDELDLVTQRIRRTGDGNGVVGIELNCFWPLSDCPRPNAPVEYHRIAMHGHVPLNRSVVDLEGGDRIDRWVDRDALPVWRFEQDDYRVFVEGCRASGHFVRLGDLTGGLRAGW